MAKKQIYVSKSILDDIHDDIDQKVYDYLVLYETLKNVDKMIQEFCGTNINWTDDNNKDALLYCDYLDNQHQKNVDKFFKNESPVRKMQYRTIIKKINEISNEFKSLGMTDMQILSLSWNDCPEKFLKVENPFNDFSLLGVNGKMYEFNGATQRAAVKYLYENTDENKTIKGRQWLAAVRSQATNPRDLFDHGNHDAWGTIIIQEPENSGKYRFYS